MQTSLTFSQHAALPDILDRLTQHYGSRPTRHQDAMRQLLYMVVAKGVAPSVGLAVFDRLQAEYPTWPRMRDARAEDLLAIFVGLPGRVKKAALIPAILRAIQDKTGDLDLDFLGRLSTDSARSWLETLPGVDHTIACAVLAFSTLRRSSLAVDKAMARPIRRLGLCDDGAPLSAVGRQVIERAPPAWSADELSSLGHGLQKLSQQVCHQGKPKCTTCPLSRLCPSSNQSAEIVPFPSRHQKASSSDRPIQLKA